MSRTEGEGLGSIGVEVLDHARPNILRFDLSLKQLVLCQSSPDLRNHPKGLY